jgi:hypothetical protein
MADRFSGDKPRAFQCLWYNNQLRGRLMIRQNSRIRAIPVEVVNPVTVVRKSELRHREDTLKLCRPVWKVILKLSMTLVCYCAGSMFASPVGAFEGADVRDEIVADAL